MSLLFSGARISFDKQQFWRNGAWRFPFWPSTHPLQQVVICKSSWNIKKIFSGQQMNLRLPWAILRQSKTIAAGRPCHGKLEILGNGSPPSSSFGPFNIASFSQAILSHRKWSCSAADGGGNNPLIPASLWMDDTSSNIRISNRQQTAWHIFCNIHKTALMVWGIHEP